MVREVEKPTAPARMAASTSRAICAIVVGVWPSSWARSPIT